MDAYEDQRSLGRGAFASVRLIKRKKDGLLMVVKRFHVPMAELTPKERSEVAQEVKLVAHLRHPNVIAFKVSRSWESQPVEVDAKLRSSL